MMKYDHTKVDGQKTDRNIYISMSDMKKVYKGKECGFASSTSIIYPIHGFRLVKENRYDNNMKTP